MAPYSQNANNNTRTTTKDSYNRVATNSHNLNITINIDGENVEELLTSLVSISRLKRRIESDHYDGRRRRKRRRTNHNVYGQSANASSDESESESVCSLTLSLIL